MEEAISVRRRALSVVFEWSRGVDAVPLEVLCDERELMAPEP